MKHALSGILKGGNEGEGERQATNKARRGKWGGGGGGAEEMTRAQNFAV